MIKINLRDLYPFYKSDLFVEVADGRGVLVIWLSFKGHTGKVPDKNTYSILKVQLRG